jgi:hypothetical protein
MIPPYRGTARLFFCYYRCTFCIQNGDKSVGMAIAQSIQMLRTTVKGRGKVDEIHTVRLLSASSK